VHHPVAHFGVGRAGEAVEVDPSALVAGQVRLDTHFGRGVTQWGELL
jgi:hypothetical protein